MLAFLLLKGKRGGWGCGRIEIEKGEIYVMVLRVPQQQKMPQASGDEAVSYVLFGQQIDLQARMRVTFQLGHNNRLNRLRKLNKVVTKVS